MNRYSYALILLLALFLTSCEQDENKKIEEQARQLNKEYKAKLQVTPVSLNTTEFLTEMFTKQVEADRESLPLPIGEGLVCTDIKVSDEAVDYTYKITENISAFLIDWDAYEKHFVQSFTTNLKGADLLIRYCVRMQIPIRYTIRDFHDNILHVMIIDVDTLMKMG